MTRPIVRRPRRLVAGPVAALVVGLWSIGFGAPATTQPAERLELVSQTTFVDDDPVVIDLRLPTELDGRRLDVRVLEPTTDPDELRTAFTLAPFENAISFFSVTDLPEQVVGSGRILSVTLPDDEIGELLRRDVGALPVVFDLIEDTGEIVATLVTAILVDDDRPGATIRLGFVADVAVPLAHRADGSVELDPDTLVEGARTVLDGAPGPALVELDPETLTALAEREGGLAVIDQLRLALADHQVALAPWVSLDEESWRRAGETARVFDHYALGAATVEQFLGVSGETVARLDPTTDGATLELLRQIGLTGGIVEPNQLDPDDLALADRRPLQIEDRNGVAFPVVAVDRTFEAELRGADPQLVAHQRFSELILQSRAAGTERGILLDLDTVDRITLDAFLGLAATTDRISVDTVDTILGLPPARDATGAVVRTSLVTTEPDDVSGFASDLRLTESTLESYVQMVEPADGPITPLRTLLLASLSDELDATERRAYTDAAFDQVVDGTRDFAVLESDRLTLASRTATIPVVVRNDQPIPINVVVRLSSDKLRLPGGDELSLVLDPGTNELAVPVETVASGDARILVSVTSPDGVLLLASGAVNVRSTAISGFGLVVSLVSLLVLLAWWARTIRRVRRQRRAASVADHEGSSGDTPSDDTRGTES